MGHPTVPLHQGEGSTGEGGDPSRGDTGGQSGASVRAVPLPPAPEPVDPVPFGAIRLECPLDRMRVYLTPLGLWFALDLEAGKETIFMQHQEWRGKTATHDFAGRLIPEGLRGPIGTSRLEVALTTFDRASDGTRIS